MQDTGYGSCYRTGKDAKTLSTFTDWFINVKYNDIEAIKKQLPKDLCSNGRTDTGRRRSKYTLPDYLKKLRAWCDSKIS